MSESLAGKAYEASYWDDALSDDYREHPKFRSYTKDEALFQELIFDDTTKTKIIRFNGEYVEVDYRRRVLSDGSRIGWVVGEPARSRLLIHKGERKPGMTTKALLNKILDTVASKQELSVLSEDVRLDLEQMLGRRITRRDLAAMQVINQAVAGDLNAFKEMTDRLEGKAVQKAENKNLNINYSDFLESLSSQDKGGEDPIDV